MNPTQERQFWITTPQLCTCIFVMPPQQIIAHLRAFAPLKNYNRLQLAINYLTITTSFDCIQRLHQELYKNLREKAFHYNVSITPLASQQEAIQHINTMRKICSDSFEDKYLQMMAKVESKIERDLVVNFCSKELKWSQDKISHAFSSPSVTQQLTVEKLLSLSLTSEKDRIKVMELREFINNLTLENQEQ